MFFCPEQWVWMSCRLYKLSVLSVCDLVCADGVSVEQDTPLWFFGIGFAESGGDRAHCELTGGDVDERVFECFDVHVGYVGSLI